MIEKRIKELESDFVIWSNILDDELIKYHNSVNSCSREYLLDEDEYLHKLLNELDKKNEEYLCLAGAKWAHPDFENASFRLDRILDLIYEQIESRKK